MTDHAPEAMTRPDRPSTLTAPRRSTPLTLNFPSRVARLGAPMQQSARDDSGEGGLSLSRHARRENVRPHFCMLLSSLVRHMAAVGSC